MKGKIKRRVTEFCKSNIFCVIMGLTDNFTQELQSVVLMVSTIGVARNDKSEACDNIFQTGHLMSRNLVKQGFHSKDSKMLLT